VSESQDKHSQQQDHFLRDLKETLDASEKSIDANTLGQLRAARREILSNSVRSEKTQQVRPGWWMPVGSLAAVATVAVVAVSLWSLPPGQMLDEQISTAEDIAMLSGLSLSDSGLSGNGLSDNSLNDSELSDAEALELYENLDFYLWLDDEKKAG